MGAMLVSVNVVLGPPGENEISVRLDGRVLRTWRSSALRGDFEALHTEAHRVADQLAGEFWERAVCRWCEVRRGEGGVR
jgi:hypothetical protein